MTSPALPEPHAPISNDSASNPRREEMPMSQTPFTRNSSRKILAGVAAGLQRQYLPQTDLTIFRVGVVVLGVATGALPLMVLGYILLALLAPEK